MTVWAKNPYLHQTRTEAKPAELIQRLQLCAEIAPFTRCLACNARREGIDVVDAERGLPDGVRHQASACWRCGGRRRIDWKGRHREAMRRWIVKICPDWVADQIGGTVRSGWPAPAQRMR